MSIEEKELREKIFNEIQMDIKAGFENCAFLGRRALLDEGYGVYTEKMVKMVKNLIIKE
jgi:hypothetical protein